MGEIIISVKDLTKSYGDFYAVKGISFDVQQGEIFGLLGPNGAGKSTTLEIIETLRQKSSGTIIVDGMNIDDNPEKIKPPGSNTVFCGSSNTSRSWDSVRL